MTDLEDSAAIAAADPAGMMAAVASLGADCRSGYAAGLEAENLPAADGISSITFVGMGGSAVSGDVLRALFSGRLGLPVDVVRSPALPEYCDRDSLVICASYSGNTAESLGAFHEAVDRGCRVVAVTSGGEMAAGAADADVAVVRVPGGMQPRAALGHLAFATLGSAEAMGVIPTIASEVAETAGLLDRLAGDLGPANSGSRAKAIARAVKGRTPVIWGSDGIGAVAAMRWKTQLNENAKVPAFWSAMSELDHNELAGWTDGSGEGFAVVAVRHAGETPAMQARFLFSLQAARDAGAATEQVEAEGDSALARLFSLIAIGDHVSVYLGLLRGVDPTPVTVIDELKRHLARA